MRSSEYKRRLLSIDWGMVASIDAFVFRTSISPENRYNLRLWYRTFFNRFDIPRGGSFDFLCFRSLSRDDYKDLFESVTGTIETSRVMVQDFLVETKLPNPRVLMELLFNWKLFSKLDGWPTLVRLYLYCRAALYTAVLKNILKTEFKRLVVFADMQPMDNLLVQFFSDLDSSTLQHGLYVDYEDSDTINVVNYRHQVARNFLAWGQDTASLIERAQPENRAVICGKPNLNLTRSAGANESTGYFSVVFDQNMFEKYNHQLLQIAYELSDACGIPFNLKFHPWNDPRTYDIQRERVMQGKPLADSRFVIGHTTSLIYELLRIGIPAYKLRSPEYALDTPEEIQFSDADELGRLVQQLPSPELCRQRGQHFLFEYGEPSLRLYREFFRHVEQDHSESI